MRNKLALLIIVIVVAFPAPARAIPIFAFRYRLSCETCHTVLPELNDFGKMFRSHGYHLPLPVHAAPPVVLRYQLEYEQEPANNSARFTPGGVLLSSEDVGNITAFVHYNLGAQGGPSGLYLGFLATYLQHSNTLLRGGLIELPLAQSPGQRLDDLQQYGYYGLHVGLNDLTLASPRWGLQVEQHVGEAILNGIIDFGEFKGAPYGGAPVPTGETTSAERPELGLFARTPFLSSRFTIGAEAMQGERNIALVGRSAFDDPYSRAGVLGMYELGKWQFQGEQWWGRDDNADGFGTIIGSSGGYLRAKYYPNPHAYLAVRYDAQAGPVITRDVVYYGAFMITPEARFLLQDVSTVGTSAHFGGAITVGFPWPTNL